jgi:alginate O-acetyltransferase complex protein AlgI
LFRSPDISHAVSYFGAMFGANSASGAPVLLAAEVYTSYHICLLLTCAAISFQPVEVYDWIETLSWPKAVALVPLFLVAVAVMFTQAFNPFLYFQF